MGVKKVSSITATKDDTKNIYKSNRRYTNRNSKSLKFPELDVNISKVSTVLLLLQSNEHDLVEKALHHLDKYASLGNHQLYELTENHIYEPLLKLIKSENMIVKKFTFKLIVQLIHVIDECRKKLLTDDGLIEETKNIFMTSTDDNLVEFSCIILQYICNDLKQLDIIGREEAFLRAIFKKFTSHDPDILLQSLRLLNLIIRNSMLISVILTMKDFPFKNLQIEHKNDCQQIQMAALESLLIISSCKHPNPFKNEYSSDRLIEEIYGMCMQSENLELQQMALKLYRNICMNDEKSLEKLSQHLMKFVQKFLDVESGNQEETLSILNEFAKLDDNRKIMSHNEIFNDVFALITENCSTEACNFVSVMSTNILCFEEIFSQNIYVILLNAVMSKRKSWENISTALLTFQKLINLQGLQYLVEISESLCRNIAEILFESPPSFIILTLITILEKLACYSELKMKICETNLLSDAVYSTLISSRHSTKLMIRLFNLIANYIDQKTFRISFNEFGMCEMIQNYLKSNVNQMKVSVCILISMSSNYQELVAQMIDSGILKVLHDNFECAICSDGYEAMLNSDMSLKFSVKRKLDVNDRITSGFYASKNVRLNFMKLREIMRTELKSPIHPVYTINFCDAVDFPTVGRKIQKDRNLIELKNSLIDNEDFKNANDDEEKIKIIARTVANFFQNDDDCIDHHFSMHLKTLKFKFSSSILPLGSLIYSHSFESALLFKALADHVNLNASLVTDKNGKSWNAVLDENNIVDLIFDVGKIYEFSSIAGQKYLKRIS